MKIKFLFSSIILILLQNFSYSQEKIEASFEASEGKIFIYYELKGDASAEYQVDIKLKRTSDPSFELVPAVMIGDVGKGKFAGGKRTIIWHLNSDEESKLQGEDFYFDVTAKKIEEGGGIPWWVFAGTAAVGGGVAAILLLKKSDSGGGTETPPNTTFPNPPARP
ncbi:MAG TPA: hypothetical protein VMT35_07695 [Ignavibacteriaceae bacterium]|nr:hypothetical protein [Ignavibacteriaceae bacterium]